MNDPLINLIVAISIVALGLWLFWPDTLQDPAYTKRYKGLFWRWQHARQMTQRVLIEDALKHLHNCEYQGRRPTVQSIAGALNNTIDKIADLLAQMQSHDLIVFEGDKLSLTPQGRDYALQIIRAHRLWERYLADKTGVAAADWHSQSERREHELTRAQTDALAVELGHPRFDPHGDPIPTAMGELISAEKGCTLPNFSLNRLARIIHLEDEPETVYAQLVAEGLYVGMTVLVTEISPQRVRFWADGDEHLLAPILAVNISVVPIQNEEKVDLGPFEPLSSLKLGETAMIVNLSSLCRGAERRRFMDLGILPGTAVKTEMVSPGGDPTAYRIRGALIGLRREQAALININREVELNSSQTYKLEII